MKNLGFFLLIVFLIAGIPADSFAQSIDTDTVKAYPLKSITTICRKTGSESTIYYQYDSLNRLVKTYSMKSNIVDTAYFCNYQYGLGGKLKSKVSGSQDTSRKRVYKYDDKGRLKSDGFDDERGNNTKNNYRYNEKGQIVEKVVTCNYNKYIYRFDYDILGRMVAEWKNDSPIISYIYKGNRLIQKTKHWIGKDVVINFVYSEGGHVEKVLEDGKVIEINRYQQDKLVFQETFYFGIDPCFDVCCMKYNYRYTYFSNLNKL